MNVVPLLLLCSLVLVAGAVVLFVICARQGDCHQTERMCLMPLEEDAVPTGGTPQEQQDRATSHGECDG